MESNSNLQKISFLTSRNGNTEISNAHIGRDLFMSIKIKRVNYYGSLLRSTEQDCMNLIV